MCLRLPSPVEGMVCVLSTSVSLLDVLLTEGLQHDLGHRGPHAADHQEVKSWLSSVSPKESGLSPPHMAESGLT